MEPRPTTTRFSVTLPEPIRQPGSTTQPSRWALWPTTQSSPMTVGYRAVQCTIVPSWTEVRAPTEMYPWSPRSTAPGQTEASRADRDPSDNNGIRRHIGRFVDLRLIVIQGIN